MSAISYNHYDLQTCRCQQYLATIMIFTKGNTNLTEIESALKITHYKYRIVCSSFILAHMRLDIYAVLILLLLPKHMKQVVSARFVISSKLRPIVVPSVWIFVMYGFLVIVAKTNSWNNWSLSSLLIIVSIEWLTRLSCPHNPIIFFLGLCLLVCS